MPSYRLPQLTSEYFSSYGSTYRSAGFKSVPKWPDIHSTREAVDTQTDGDATSSGSVSGGPRVSTETEEQDGPDTTTEEVAGKKVDEGATKSTAHGDETVAEGNGKEMDDPAGDDIKLVFLTFFVEGVRTFGNGKKETTFKHHIHPPILNLRNFIAIFEHPSPTPIPRLRVRVRLDFTRQVQVHNIIHFRNQMLKAQDEDVSERKRRKLWQVNGDWQSLEDAIRLAPEMNLAVGLQPLWDFERGVEKFSPYLNCSRCFVPLGRHQILIEEHRSLCACGHRPGSDYRECTSCRLMFLNDRAGWDLHMQEH